MYNTVAGLRGGIPDSESKSINSGSPQLSPTMHCLRSRTRHTRASRIIEKIRNHLLVSCMYIIQILLTYFLVSEFWSRLIKYKIANLRFASG